jgi:hypothetical protein
MSESRHHFAGANLSATRRIYESSTPYPSDSVAAGDSSAVKKSTHLLFVIQKHLASHLHFDSNGMACYFPGLYPRDHRSILQSSGLPCASKTIRSSILEGFGRSMERLVVVTLCHR